MDTPIHCRTYSYVSRTAIERAVSVQGLLGYTLHYAQIPNRFSKLFDPSILHFYQK